MLHPLFYKQKQSPRGAFQERCSTNNLDSLQENIHAKVLLQSWFVRKYATYLQQNVIFREHIWRTASAYRSKYRVYKWRGSLSASKKLFEIHFNTVNTFSNFICDFFLATKGKFLEATAVVDKTQKRG